MKAFAVLMFLVGIMALFPLPEERTGRDALQAQAVAINFITFRTAVMRYAYSAKPANGTGITEAQLDLPHGWKTLRPWQARVVNGLCLVWGETTHAEHGAVREILRGSYAVGIARNGLLEPGHGKSVPVPGVPDGNLVSVFVV